MDALDDLIRQYLQKRASAGAVRGAWEPSAEELLAYLSGHSQGAELERMLDYLKRDEDGQNLVMLSRRLLESPDWENHPVHPALVRQAQALMPTGKNIQCPHCKRGITPFKKSPRRQLWMNALWLLTAIAAFSLSFVFRRYFMQWLVLATLAGIKAIVEMRAAKTQVLIYKALSEDTPGKERDLQQQRSRL